MYVRLVKLPSADAETMFDIPPQLPSDESDVPTTTLKTPTPDEILTTLCQEPRPLQTVRRPKYLEGLICE